MHNIHTAIKKTLAFFDSISHPLTREEVYQLLWSEGILYTFGDVMQALDDMVSKDILGCTDGMYYFVGREDSVIRRHARVYEVERKLKIAQRAVKLLRMMPFVRAIFLCNSVGFGTADTDSDIDVLMVVRHGHIWAARLLCNMILKMFGLRTSGDHLKDKICLSFIITDTRLNFAPVQLSHTDVYQTYWLMHLIAIYDPDDLHTSIMRANGWLTTVVHPIPHDIQVSHRVQIADSVWSLRIRLLLTNLCHTASRESWCKKIQLPRLETFYGDVAKYADTRVIISDDMVKLHKNDRRAWFQSEWEKRGA